MIKGLEAAGIVMAMLLLAWSVEVVHEEIQRRREKAKYGPVD